MQGTRETVHLLQRPGLVTQNFPSIENLPSMKAADANVFLRPKERSASFIVMKSGRGFLGDVGAIQIVPNEGGRVNIGSNL